MSVPFGDIGPISFLLGFVEVSIKVDDKFADEALSELAGFELIFGEASAEVLIFPFADISADLGWHLNFILYINLFNSFIHRLVVQSTKPHQNSKSIKNSPCSSFLLVDFSSWRTQSWQHRIQLLIPTHLQRLELAWTHQCISIYCTSRSFLLLWLLHHLWRILNLYVLYLLLQFIQNTRWNLQYLLSCEYFFLYSDFWGIVS